ncbi:MAG: maltose ABC transporter substrate-binding protein [Intrasporangiaceae bacterium]|nr:maltose ABC transporter substrate-binding protein [Intrasporangiaceae bacterium]
MRKRNLLVVALAAPALLLTACGDSADTTATDTGTDAATEDATTDDAATEEETTEEAAPAEEETAAPERDENVDLVIWTDADRAETVTKFAEEFGEENGVTTAVQIAVETRQQFREATEVGQGPDVTVGAHDWLGEFVQNGVVAPVNLSSDVQSLFAENAVAAASFDGQNYGVPYATENLALIRNTDLAPDAPATMADLVAAGESSGAEHVLIQPVGQTGNAYYTYPYLSACGGGIFAQDDTGGYIAEEVIVNSPESIKGAEQMAALGAEGILSTSIGDDNAEGLFTAGDAAFMISGPWAIPNIEEAGINYEVSPLPALEGCDAMKPFLGVQLFYVSSKAKNAALAQEFVANYITREDVQLRFFEELGRTPANLAALETASAEDPIIEAFSAAGEGAAPMPNIPAMNSVWGPLGQAGADIVSGQDVTERFTAAQDEIVSAIAGG